MDKSQRMGYRRERGDVTMDTWLGEYITAGPEHTVGNRSVKQVKLATINYIMLRVVVYFIIYQLGQLGFTVICRNIYASFCHKTWKPISVYIAISCHRPTQRNASF